MRLRDDYCDARTEGGKKKEERARTEETNVEGREGRERVSTGTDTLSLKIGLQISTQP